MAKKEEMEKLFGMFPNKVSTNMLIFEEPNKTTWEKAADKLNVQLTKNQAWAMCQALQPLLRSGGAVLVKKGSNGKLRPAAELQDLFSQATNKTDMTRALALILCTPANFRKYTDRLTTEQRQLWEVLLDRLYVTEREALQLLHTDRLVVKEKRHGYYYYNTTEKFDPPELMCLQTKRSISATIHKYGYRDYETFITFPAALYEYFMQAFHPERRNILWITRTDLPSADYTVCNYEMDSVAKYPLLKGFLRAGKISMKSKGFSLSDVKRAAKSMGLIEIFGNDAVKGSDQESMRGRYYIEPLALNHTLLTLRDEKSDALPLALHNLFCSKFSRLCYYLTPLLLPHIKGLRRNFTEDNMLSELLNTYISLLRKHPDKWISIVDALHQLMSQDTGNAYVPFSAQVFSSNGMSELYDLKNEYSHKDIAIDSFVSEFGLTALKAFSLMLCSLGMAEVALSPLHHSESPFGRAEFLRLTALGRYALGIAHEYQPPHIDQQAYFELDPERLIIRSLATPNPYSQLLRDSSVPISKNRYETSASSFLAHCKSRDDVEKNIEIFKQFISSDLPPLWKQFFDSLLKHCNPLKQDTTSYNHFQLSPDDNELIHLITTDEKLRQLVVRAEGFRLLVRSSDMTKFEERLKKHGYLL